MLKHTPFNWGKLLREMRQEKNLSIKDLGQMCGVNASTISSIENGKRGPGVDTLEKILFSLGYELDAVIIDAPPLKFISANTTRDRLSAKALES